jgi:hypothetical protein
MKHPTPLYYTIAQAAPLAGITEGAFRGELQRSPHEFRGCPVLRADNGRIRLPAVKFLEALGLLPTVRNERAEALRSAVCDRVGVDPLAAYRTITCLMELRAIAEDCPSAADLQAWDDYQTVSAVAVAAPENGRSSFIARARVNVGRADRE